MVLKKTVPFTKLLLVGVIGLSMVACTQQTTTEVPTGHSDAVEGRQSPSGKTEEMRTYDTNYINFEQGKFDLAVTSRNEVVLFYNSGDNCDECRDADKSLARQINKFHPRLTVFLIEDATVAAEYGLTNGDNFALVDENGEVVKTWTGDSYQSVLDETNLVDLEVE
ncbi:hypothetical protein KC717_05760 [Candidatus Dojkabacteria bacterium]|uniref:Thioredoxin domain-containing protein n=1 Tax=Candidatus Dojkabacteria bacterium TaxID=2099670 RepID=A0A955RKT9_9BACT|nr:hypothetical protein [Candidatus Dojkabacteria bacterium]